MRTEAKKTSLIAALLALVIPTSLLAQQDVDTLSVAAAPCPPFVLHENGELTGLSIFLWDQVASEMGVGYEIIEAPLSEMLTAISENRAIRQIDVGISCLSITAERERLIDFSHSYYETYTGIAVRQRGIWDIVKGIFTNPAVLKVLGIILAIAALLGSVFFLLERDGNKKLFSSKTPIGRTLEGLIVGLLFVTRGPIRFYQFKSLPARVLAAILTIASTLMIASITAILASAFTLNSLNSQVTGLDDLADLRVGALEASTSSQFLETNGIVHQTRTDLMELIADLDSGELDAVISDAAFLKYTIRQGQRRGEYDSLSVLLYELDTQNYGFALQEDSPLRESMNQALLKVRTSPSWSDEVARYLGN